jgi:hypothetical protein
MAANPANFEKALTSHDHIKRSTGLPIFYANSVTRLGKILPFGYFLLGHFQSLI